MTTNLADVQAHVQVLPDSSGGDERLTRDLYERNDEQNDELGLKDMKTENYGEE